MLLRLTVLIDYNDVVDSEKHKAGCQRSICHYRSSGPLTVVLRELAGFCTFLR